MADILAGRVIRAIDLALSPITSDDTTDVSTASTSYVFGSTPVSAVFVAPPSGRAEVQVWGTQDNDTEIQSSYLTFQVREGTSQTGTVVSEPGDEAVYRTAGTTRVQAGSGRMYLVDGLSPGDTYSAWARIRVSGGTGTWFHRAIYVKPTV